mmetsp:Transcript_6501/g.9290  ORF Transcript_6501/g.9290 Transcript_6501/m.9290 type:complete len:591 (+) Transcript_6501:101-1873(+)
MVQISRGSRQLSSSKFSISQILLTIVLCAVSYYSGTVTHKDSIGCENVNDLKNAVKENNNVALNDSEIEALVQKRVRQELSAAKEKLPSSAKETQYFSNSVSQYMNGVVRVPKDGFVKKYDYGPPMDAATDKNGDVMIFYNSPKALPSDDTHQHMAQFSSGAGIGVLEVDDATANCDTMNVINTNNPGNTRQCLAIVGNYESYNVQRWMRVPMDGGKLDKSLPMRAVSRGYASNGSQQFMPPKPNNIKKHWGMLETYFRSIEETLGRLKSIADKIAKDNTIIVMTCNMGQSELLMNFVCNARSKGLSTDNVLVFPTDQNTKDLAEGLGLATFYDEKNFGRLPSGEARAYGDRTFTAMMFAKVVCVQIINFMGYDLLFQDVDVVWYKNPLEYFHDKKNPHYNFDMYFQDDGARGPRYAPYSANSGFYYVRNNEMTKYFFTSLLYSGDQILQCTSHQQVLIQVMTEHASHFGLRVKVLERDMEEFPGGWHYHRNNKTFMKKLIDGKVNPQIFHMSWTKNKDNKIKFFQQMAEWYTEDKCIQRKRKDIADEDSSLVESCCLSEPNIVCHYRDKPSKIPCKDSDPIDKGHPSFW